MDVVLVSFLLTLNKFHTLPFSHIGTSCQISPITKRFHCRLLTPKYLLGCNNYLNYKKYRAKSENYIGLSFSLYWGRGGINLGENQQNTHFRYKICPSKLHFSRLTKVHTSFKEHLKMVTYLIFLVL